MIVGRYLLVFCMLRKWLKQLHSMYLEIRLWFPAYLFTNKCKNSCEKLKLNSAVIDRPSVVGVVLKLDGVGPVDDSPSVN